MSETDHAGVLEAFVEEYTILDEVIGELGDDQLMLPSGCEEWSNADLVFHLLLDAQRALVTFNTPAEGPPDRDFATYWRGFQSMYKTAQDHARFVRVSTAAHSSPGSLTRRWKATAQAAVNAAASLDVEGFVATQGHTLSTSDFLSTLTVEACVHHLDLLASLPEASGPGLGAIAFTKRTIEALLAQPVPQGWDDVTLILKATGRQPLTADDHSSLSDPTALPVFS